MPSYKVINPADKSVVAEYIHTDAATTETRLNEIYRLGISQQERLTNFKRSEILLNLADLLESNKESLALMITEQTGKVINESRAEVKRAVLTTKIASEESKRLFGESRLTNSFSHGEQKISLTQRKPYGVVFAITPFNFPLNLALHKIAAAFASGNCVLYKPSDINFALGERLVQLCHDAGFPEHSIKFICPNEDTLNTIVQDKRIHVINFTGGTKTADKIAALAGRKKLLLELGGNDAMAVFPGVDLNRAANEAVAGRFGTCGQKCIANKRVYIHDSIYEEFKTYIKEYASDYNFKFPESPMSETAKLGPLVNEQSAQEVEALVESAIANRATVLTGHKREGAYYQATVLENVLDDEQLLKEETFGPVLSLSKFSTEDELIKRINASPYGLQAGIFTQDLTLAKRMFDKIEVGTVLINQGPANRDEYLPFGGVKNSGMGREGVKYAMEEMTYIKQLIM